VSGGPQAETTERRSTAIGEAAVVVGAGLAVAWLIPGQTTHGPVLGLSPAFQPTACVIAIIALGLLGLALRLARPQPLKSERTAPAWPAALILGTVVAGLLTLQYLGPVACGLVIVALGLAVLGERRLPILLGTMAASALILVITFQPWR
jgi:hypothetical protein